MKSFVKFPVLALLGLSALGTAFSGTAAIAGSTTTIGADAEPGSSIGVIFVPAEAVSAIVSAIRSSPQIAAAIINTISGVLVSISGGGTLTSVGGLVVVLTESSADLLIAVLSGALSLADSGEFEQFLAGKSLRQIKQDGESDLQMALEQQIADELALSGVEMNVSRLVKSLMGLSDSPEKLPVATDAMNDLVESASREEMEALASSPSITAIRQVLTAGNAALQ